MTGFSLKVTLTHLNVSTFDLVSKGPIYTEVNNSHLVNPVEAARRERLATIRAGIPEQSPLASD